MRKERKAGTKGKEGRHVRKGRQVARKGGQVERKGRKVRKEIRKGVTKSNKKEGATWNGGTME